jgi:hypothetical protein
MDFAAFLSSIVAALVLFAVGSILRTGTDRKRPAILAMSEAAVFFIGIAALTSISSGCHRPDSTTDEKVVSTTDEKVVSTTDEKVVSTTDEKVVTNRPIEVSEGGYVSSQNCGSCHPHQYDTWQSSYHSTMTRVTTPQSVVAPFDNVPLVLDGANYLLLRRGDQFFVRMDDPAWKGRPKKNAPQVEREIVMATGSHHFQAYWLATGHGRNLSIFEFCFRMDENRWMPLKSAFLYPPQAPPLMDQQHWNTNCISCHAVVGKPRLLPKNRMKADTHVAEFGIACEACHGPGERHVLANQDSVRLSEVKLGERSSPTIINPTTLPAPRDSQVCGQCHSIQRRSPDQLKHWNVHGTSFRPGDDLASSLRMITEGDKYFWPDGMVRVSGREYHGLINSPCFMHGDQEKGIMSCFSCHQMHQTEGDERDIKEWADDQLIPGMRGNQACTQCHPQFKDEQRLADHTFHAPDSSGSSCYNCHMPHTTWGLLKGIRSHQVDSPSVQSSLVSGRPNACNLCHLDKTLDWTSDHLAQRYGIPKPELDEDTRSIAASVLWILRGDAGQRALLAWSMGWAAAREASGSEWMAPYLAQLLPDPYDAVRFRAYVSLRELPGYENFQYDFAASPDHRRRAKEQAFHIWNEAAKTDIRWSGRAEVLVNSSGSLMHEIFARLRSQRDHRPVQLAE